MYSDHTWLGYVIIAIYAVVWVWDHNHTVKWPFPSRPHSQEGCYLTTYNCHSPTPFLYLLWPELYVPAAWDMTWLVCIRREERRGKTSRLDRNSINTWLYVFCFVFFSEKWIYQEHWQWKLSSSGRRKFPGCRGLTVGWLGYCQWVGAIFCFSEKWLNNLNFF